MAGFMTNISVDDEEVARALFEDPECGVSVLEKFAGMCASPENWIAESNSDVNDRLADFLRELADALTP